jgi:hypothetical protein
MKRAALLAALSLPMLSAGAVDGDARLDIILKIEATVRLPAAAGPVGTYDRTYQFPRIGRVHATYVLSRTPGSPHIHIRPANAVVATPEDGGCGVVQFDYDVTSQRFSDMACNGLA